jgi:lipopolysaccharide export system protein LptA
MENADRFEGYRSRGEYVLSGKVRFRHGELRVETERAVWQKDRNIVFCEAGMRITRNGALLTAERGTYDKNLGQATAQGKVFMRDSAGEVAATGQSIVYMRFKHMATLTGNPEVRRFYPKKDTARADSARPGNAPVTAGARPGADSGGKGPDTLSIKGDVMTYDDSLQVAIADGNVRIDRDKLHITCKKAEYHDASDSLYLLGDPQVIVDDNQVKGEIMRLGMHGEEIKSLLVKGKAQAHSVEPATDSTAARQSDVKGDSLFLAFKEKAIDSVQVFRNANGAYFDVDKPAYVNKMSGEYMVLRFSGKQVASANVLGRRCQEHLLPFRAETFEGKERRRGRYHRLRLQGRPHRRGDGEGYRQGDLFRGEGGKAGARARRCGRDRRRFVVPGARARAGRYRAREGPAVRRSNPQGPGGRPGQPRRSYAAG